MLLTGGFKVVAMNGKNESHVILAQCIVLQPMNCHGVTGT